MILQTGGRASGEISTRSMPSSCALRSASEVSMTPNCSISGPTTRMGVMRIMWFTRMRCTGPASRLNRPNAMGKPPQARIATDADGNIPPAPGTFDAML